MTATQPLVSVVIPAFNHARFLPSAIESALVQRYPRREIIVVDDGSTDETPDVVSRYGETVCYVRQANKGLAAARNTGIERARGEFIALLDSDDVWLAGFLDRTMSVVDQRPDGTVYFSAWRYVDSGGRPLPEPPHVHTVPPARMYRALLRANFIVPSTVVMRRSAIVAAGMFDERFRRLQDWDLWIRLARTGHRLIGAATCHVHYRLHNDALSADRPGGQAAALALAEKHFGPDDGRFGTWSAEKRLGYAGVYRYCALHCAAPDEDTDQRAALLRKALEMDPTLCTDRSLFHELAWSNLPAGHRGCGTVAVEKHARIVFHLLDRAFQGEANNTRRRSHGYAHLAIGSIAYGCGQLAHARRHLLRAMTIWPPLLLDTQLGGLLVRSCLGAGTLARLKRLRARTTPGLEATR